jgi:hypothetical protein
MIRGTSHLRLHQRCPYKKPGPIAQTGPAQLKPDVLETQRRTQIYRAEADSSCVLASWPIDNAECLAEHIQRAWWVRLRITICPPRMIQNIVHTGKELQANALDDLESLGNGHVPLERVFVADKQLLSKFAGRSVWN